MFKLLASVIFISIIDFYYCVIHLQSYTICNEKSNMIKTNVTLKTGLNNNFSVDIDAMLPISLGDNIRIMLKLEMLRHTKWIELLNTAENSFCQFTKHFAGDLYHDFERAANIKPDTCPLDKGDYHVRDFKLNLERLGYKLFPRGTVKISGKAYLKSGNKEIYCGALVAKNV